jgi:hypothetical protein
VEAATAERRTSTARWVERMVMLRSVPMLAHWLVADNPERGQLNRKAIAVLVGGAPPARESGRTRGRQEVRAGASGYAAACGWMLWWSRGRTPPCARSTSGSCDGPRTRSTQADDRCQP